MLPHSELLEQSWSISIVCDEYHFTCSSGNPIIPLGAGPYCTSFQQRTGTVAWFVLCMANLHLSKQIQRLDVSRRFTRSSWRSLRALPSDLWKKLVTPTYEWLVGKLVLSTVTLLAPASPVAWLPVASSCSALATGRRF
jgi:hypothetical protein